MISKERDLLFSCSNDKTIGLWKIPQNYCEESNKTQGPYITLSNIHKDYIKELSYSVESNTLFSCGFDGVIAQYNLDEIKKGKIYSGNEAIYSQQSSLAKNSFYSLSCDSSGKLLIASMYENVRINHN